MPSPIASLQTGVVVEGSGSVLSSDAVDSAETTMLQGHLEGVNDQTKQARWE